MKKGLMYLFILVFISCQNNGGKSVIFEGWETEENSENKGLVEDNSAPAYFDNIYNSENQSVNEEQIYVFTEEMPSFEKGTGKEGFIKFIVQELQYPKAAKDNGIDGTVYVQFIVNKEGNVENAKVVRGTDPALDKEALRVVKKSLRWYSPGKQDGEPVSVHFVFPIKFVLQ